MSVSHDTYSVILNGRLDGHYAVAIEWDSLVVEMGLLAVIIYGAVWLEVNVERRKTRKQEAIAREQIVQFVTDDQTSLHK
jgi:hypothetical protein